MIGPVETLEWPEVRRTVISFLGIVLLEADTILDDLDNFSRAGLAAALKEEAAAVRDGRGGSPRDKRVVGICSDGDLNGSWHILAV